MSILGASTAVGVWRHLVWAAIFLVGCRSTVSQPEGSQPEEDASCTEGETVPTDDGCNTCICQADGSLGLCTTRYCGECFYDSQEHEIGDSFPSTDGCNSCTCESTGVVCTNMDCITCECNGHTYQVGDEFVGDICGETCLCDESGEVHCEDCAS